MQCVAVCGSELQCFENERVEARRAAGRTSAGNMLQCVAVCCSVLQCFAVCYSVTVLQCVAVCCCSNLLLKLPRP